MISKSDFPSLFHKLALRCCKLCQLHPLCFSLNGQGGGEKEVINIEQLSEEEQHKRLINLVEDPIDKYDKKKFTKEDRKIIVNNVVKSLETKKVIETKKLEALEYKLSQNYPNPFNPTTKINYEIKDANFVSIKIYDLLGREIAELVNERQDAGRYIVNFDARRYLLASGIYFYRIKAGDFVDTKRMVLVK